MELFDNWTEQYDRWFTTPTGRLVKQYESELLLELLDPQPGEQILDVGCGTGIFTVDVLERGAGLTGIDLSMPMVGVAVQRFQAERFDGLCADMCKLPFADASFDRVFSMTAIEFVEDGVGAIAELERVTRPGGTIVATTLNSLSPWAEQRREKGRQGHSLFAHAVFRSPDDMRALVKRPCICATAIHFSKDTHADDIPAIESKGQLEKLDNGALLAVQWQKAD